MDGTIDTMRETEAPSRLEGILKRVVFRNPDTGWTVARLGVLGKIEPITVTGHLPDFRPGDRLRIHGRWEVDRRYGKQFRVEACVTVPPTTAAGIRKYLSSGRFPGVGEVLAARILDAFGTDTLEVLKSRPERLREVEGIGRNRAEKIREIFSRERSNHDVMIFLRGHEVSVRIAARIHKRYGSRTIAVIRENPYRLAREITGIGFLTADRIGRSLGIPDHDPRRIRAGVGHFLAQGSLEGHLFLPRHLLLRKTAIGLDCDPGLVEEAIEDLAGRGEVILEDLAEGQGVFQPELHQAELGVAEGIRDLARTPVQAARIDWEQVFGDLEVEFGTPFAKEQREAMRQALSSSALVITGGPGTGKTTLIRGLLQILEGQGKRISLCAPTGRAARRIREATGREARTIHRLLEFHPRSQSFLRDRAHPLETDVVVIDESSMVDMVLAYHLLEAIPIGCQVIFVGDSDQLPPVGPGNLLRDLLDSRCLQVVRLVEVFRQARESAIVRNAHRVRRGEMPLCGSEDENHDFIFLERKDPERIVETLRELVADRIPARFGLDPVRDIQVLSPMHRGPIGVQRLNQEFQKVLNPHGQKVTQGSHPLRVGDKVMQLRNNYEREVFNGDIGRVETLNTGEKWIGVRFGDRLVSYGTEDLDELDLAYACTVHKSQGSEYPVVVVVLHTQHAIMLQRNLLYTAITRARQALFLVGTRQALHLAVRNRRTQKRFTNLGQRLVDFLS